MACITKLRRRAEEVHAGVKQKPASQDFPYRYLIAWLNYHGMNWKGINWLQQLMYVFSTFLCSFKKY
jgi:hypothetical protein